MKSKFLLSAISTVCLSMFSFSVFAKATAYDSSDECVEAATTYKNGSPLAEFYFPTAKKVNARVLDGEVVKTLPRSACAKAYVVGSKSKFEKDALWVYIKGGEGGLPLVFDKKTGEVLRMKDCENSVFELVEVEKPKQSKKEESQPEPTAKIEGVCEGCLPPEVTATPQIVATPLPAPVPTPVLTPVGNLTPIQVQLVPQGQPTQTGQQTYFVIQPGGSAPAQTVVIQNPGYPAQPPVVYQPPSQPPVYPPPYQPPGCYSPNRMINNFCTTPPGVITNPSLPPPRQPGPVYPPPYQPGPPVVSPPIQGPGVVTNPPVVQPPVGGGRPGVVTNPPTLLPPVIGGPGGSGNQPPILGGPIRNGNGYVNQPVVGGPVYGGGGGYVNQPVVSAPRPNVVTSNGSNINNVYVRPPVNYGGGNTNNVVYVGGPVSNGQVNNNTTYLQIPAAPVQNGGVRPGTNTGVALLPPKRN